MNFLLLSQKYLLFCNVSEDTKKGYQRILNKYWIPAFGDCDITQIKYENILLKILDYQFKTNKTYNNVLTPLRGVFKFAKNLDIIYNNPMDKIVAKKVQKKLPDPFTKQEVFNILSWLKYNLEAKELIYYDYYKLAFFSGLRPSEIIALYNEDIQNDVICVNKSRVRGTTKYVTKTFTQRFVLIHPNAKQVLDKLCKQHTKYLFINPITKKAFYNEKPFRIRFMRALKSLNIRKRPAYNTRHTYATMLLMAGANPTFVANQLGHSLTMLCNHYGRWLYSKQDFQELNKLKIGEFYEP